MTAEHIIKPGKNNRKLLIAFFGLSFLFNICQAQQKSNSTDHSDYRAVNWDGESGLLAQTWHIGMVKDKNGFFWAASNWGEISRFDGHRFKFIRPFKEKGDPQFSFCHKIMPDSLGNLWFATNKGLIKLDIQADTFVLIDSRRSKQDGINVIEPIAITSREAICFLEDSIVSYDLVTLNYTMQFNLSGIDEWEKTKNGASRKSAYYEPRTKSVWLALGGEEGLLQLYPEQKKFKVHRRVSFKSPVDREGRGDTEAIVDDPKRNCIWTNSHDGLYKFNLDDYSFRRITIFDSYVTKNYFRHVGIDIDRDGKVWFANDTLGIIAYDPDSDSIYRPLSDVEENRAIAEANLKIYCDPDGMIWLSYWINRGINQLVRNHISVKNYNVPPDMSSNIMAGKNGQLWMGSRFGFNIFDPWNGEFKLPLEKDFHGLDGNSIIPFAIDSTRNRFWINAGSRDNIYAVDINSRNCEKIQLFDEDNKKLEPGGTIAKMTIPFRKGFLLLDNNGIFYFDRDSLVARRVIQPFGSLVFQMLNIGDSVVTMITPLIGNGYSTFAWRNNAFVKISHRADSIRWSSIFYDNSDKTYWAGVEKDIVHLNDDFTPIRIYARLVNDAGLMNHALIQSEDKNIWFADSRGEISMLDISNGQFVSLSQYDGYQKQDFSWFGATSVRLGKELYFLGSSLSKLPTLLVRISTDLFRYPGSQVYISEFRVQQKAVSLKTISENQSVIDLKSNQNQLSIETGILDFYSRGKSSIRYKIEGADSNWHYAPYYNTISFDELGLGKHTILLQASNAANEFSGPVKSIVINIHPMFWETWWFRLPVALAILGTGYVFLRRNIRNKFRKRIERSEKERQIAELKQKSAELEMQALRAQMNPHFIFNSLNSINRFILQNNRLQASEFLTKFSRLIRLILQNSQVPYITLESELESLGLYLELEALRFDYRFAYKISVDEQADVSTLLVPPLMIQPYVENAIWHGLMNKKGNGQLDIKVSQEGKYVYIRVADDGVGRKQAAALASKSATKHKSVGLQITEHRIAMMHTENGAESPVSINDLMSPEGEPAGTEVIIKIPEMYD